MDEVVASSASINQGGVSATVLRQPSGTSGALHPAYRSYAIA
jgi:hypothetical protein